MKLRLQSLSRSSSEVCLVGNFLSFDEGGAPIYQPPLTLNSPHIEIIVYIYNVVHCSTDRPYVSLNFSKGREEYAIVKIVICKLVKVLKCWNA